MHRRRRGGRGNTQRFSVRVMTRKLKCITEPRRSNPVSSAPAAPRLIRSRLQQVLYRITARGRGSATMRHETLRRLPTNATRRRVIKPARARWKAGRARERDRLAGRRRVIVPLSLSVSAIGSDRLGAPLRDASRWRRERGRLSSVVRACDLGRPLKKKEYTLFSAGGESYAYVCAALSGLIFLARPVRTICIDLRQPSLAGVYSLSRWEFARSFPRT